MQMSVSLTNQRQRISRLLVSLRPANAANTDEGAGAWFHYRYSRGKKGKKRKRERKAEGKRERWNEKESERDRKMETNVCENTGPLFRALSTPNIKLAKWMVQDRGQHTGRREHGQSKWKEQRGGEREASRACWEWEGKESISIIDRAWREWDTGKEGERDRGAGYHSSLVIAGDN